MIKLTKKLLGVLCYCAGVFFSLYVGGYLMLIKPINQLMESFGKPEFTMTLLIVSLVKIALCTTVAGLVWCIGYMGYNYFKGTEDPDWKALEEKWRAKKEKKENDN